jgi:ferredoxin--NADP+ reductase
MVARLSHNVHPVTITFAEQIAAGIYLFGFKREFKFRAGQVIGIAQEEHGPHRLYSICSGEKDDEVLILYNLIEEGYLTPRLSELESGDIIWITKPRGEFTCDDEPAVWIATGTGIAPFYSMFRTGMASQKILIHGSRTLEQFYFFDDFKSLLGSNYIRCSTAEHDVDVYSGRVTEYLKEQPILNPWLKYYLCGSAEMVVETRDILINKGIPFDQIISEIYF